MSCAYETALKAQRKNNTRAWLEPVILFAAILAYCALMANREADEQQAQMDESSSDRQRVCLIRQGNEIHQFDCNVVNKTYARLD